MEYLGSEEVGNPSTVASTSAAVGMASTSTVELTGTLLVARKREGVFCRQTSTLEHGGFRKAYST